MTHVPPAAGLVVDASGALLVIAIGVAVLVIRPRTRTSLAFGAFATSFGAQFFVTHLGLYLGHAPSSAALPPSYEIVRSLLRTSTSVALLFLAVSFPRPIRADERGLLVPPVLLALIVSAVGGVAFTRSTFAIGAGPLSALSNVLVAVVLGALYGTLLLLALRYRHEPAAERRRTYALAYFALAIYPGFVAGAGVGADRVTWLWSGLFPFVFASLAAMTILAVVWLGSAFRDGRRVPMLLALASVALPLAGALYTTFGRELGGAGASRIATVVVLAYAILRGQVLGFEVKLRWGVSRGTIAAAFVAVFFLVSEGAQLVLGASNAYVGLVGAAMLVFALAPLQRVAERFATRVVPLADDAAPAVPAPAAEAYRRAVRLALRDHALTREEERHLLDLAHHLRIPPSAAGQIHDEVERELRGSG